MFMGAKIPSNRQERASVVNRRRFRAWAPRLIILISQSANPAGLAKYNLFSAVRRRASTVAQWPLTPVRDAGLILQ